MWGGKSLRLRNNRPGFGSRLCYFLTTCPPVKLGSCPGVAVKMEDNEHKGAHHVTRMCSGERVSPSQPWTVSIINPPKNTSLPNSHPTGRILSRPHPHVSQKVSLKPAHDQDRPSPCSGAAAETPDSDVDPQGPSQVLRGGCVGGSVTVTVYQTGGAA